MRRVISLIFCLGLGANGIWMLAAPGNWYVVMPGVAGTGPANIHFIRDIGAAYLAGAACLVWLVRSSSGWPAAFAFAMFLVLHALVHIWDTVAGREGLLSLLRDLPTVVLPAIFTLWLAWPPYHLKRGVPR